MLKIKLKKIVGIGVSLLLFLGLVVVGFQLLSPETKIFLYRRYTSPKYSLYVKYAQFFLDQKVPIYYISKKNLDYKLTHPAEWIQKQIKGDFEHYQDVSTKNVMATYHTFPASDLVVLFQIENGIVKITKKEGTTLNGSAEYGLKIYTNIFEYLAKHGYVGNLSFLLRLSDFISNASEQQVNTAAPILTTAKDLSKAKEKGFVLIPDYMSLEDIPNKMADRVLFANTVFPWKNKENNILWRGGHADISGFRAKVVAFSEQHPESMVDAKFTDGPDNKKVFLSPEMQVKAKYLLTIDGHTAAWTRPIWQLLSNSVMLKQDSPIVQWYYAALKPGVDYIPVSSDPTQLEIRVKAYTDLELQSIAQHGSDFAKNNLMFDDMIAYMVQVLRTYEGLQTKADHP